MPPATSPRLICLCASRIRTSERLRYLRYFLTSVSEQTTTDFKLFLGISFHSPELRQEFDALVKTLPSTIHIFLCSKKQSQFERYQSILEALRTKKHITPDKESSTYIAFTDDDDLWSPRQMEAYRLGMHKLHSDPRKPPFSFNITHFSTSRIGQRLRPTQRIYVKCLYLANISISCARMPSSQIGSPSRPRNCWRISRAI
jgi:hypothetical protein